MSVLTPVSSDDPVRVFVTTEDIELGKRGDPDLCAFGRALSRAVGGTVVTRLYGSWVLDGPYAGTYGQHNARIRNWITRYDAKEEVFPTMQALVLVPA